MVKNSKIPASPIYGYLRQWFDFAFENQGKVTGNHTGMYCWFVEQNNRLGWAKEFGTPRDQTMAAVGISSYNTYKKCFNDLAIWGFIKIVKSSKNQYTANIIALLKFDKAKYKALDKALIEQRIKHSEGTVSGTVALLNIPIDNTTTIPLNNIVVVDSVAAINFFCGSKIKRVLEEKYKITGPQIEKKFEEFYNLKIDLNEFDNKNCADISRHFSYWLPDELTRENNFSKNNKNGKHTAASAAGVVGKINEMFSK